jgi:DNA repair exonuclease SbcCD ATPase subunit
MRITVKNYRAVESAEIELEHITLVAGPNRAGKSSLAQAIATVITGDRVVLDGLSQSEVGMLIRSGAAESELKIEGPTGHAALTLPRGKPRTEGARPPRASRFALGLSCALDLEPKDRVRLFYQYLKPEPTAADLQAALPGLNAKSIEKILERIKLHGWDATHEQAKESGTKQKGQWESVTQERYGSQKSTSWAPAGWSNDLATASLEQLTGELTRAEEERDIAIGSTAISGEERARLEILASKVPRLTAAVEAQEIATHDSARLVDEARKARAALPDPQEATDPHAEQRAALTARADNYAAAVREVEQFTGDIVAAEEDVAEARKFRDSLPEPSEAVVLQDGTLSKCPSCGSDVLITHSQTLCHPPSGAAKKAAKEAAKQAEVARQAIAKADQQVRAFTQGRDTVADAKRLAEAKLADATDACDALTKLPAALDLEEAKLTAIGRKVDIGLADGEIDMRQEEAAQEQRKLGALDAELKAAQAAAAQLKELPADTVTEESVNQCRERVRAAEQRIAIFKAKTEADKLAANIAINQQIVAALAPTGVRQIRLAQAFGDFNARLKALCQASGWPTIEIDAEMNASFDGFAYRLFDQHSSVRWRIRAVLNLAFAQLDGSDLFIADAADVLDGPGRNGLFKMIKSAAIPALVLMTEKQDRVPDLARAGLGRSYWLSQGVASEISAAKAAA